MMRRLKLSTASIALVAVPAAAGPVIYDIYLEGPAVVVKVNTFGLKKNEVIKNSPIKAIFSTNNGQANRSYNLGTLQGGEVYEWHKMHGVAGVKSVSADAVTWATRVKGGKSDENFKTTKTIGDVFIPPPTESPIVTHCKNYTRIAIQQFNDARNRQCGFAGNRWSPNFNHHFNWCTAVPVSASNAETQARANMIAQCAKK